MALAEKAAAAATVEQVTSQSEKARLDQEVIAKDADLRAAQEEFKRAGRAWAADKSAANERRLADAVVSAKAAEDLLAQARVKATEAATASLAAVSRSAEAAKSREIRKARVEELRKLVDRKLK